MFRGGSSNGGGGGAGSGAASQVPEYDIDGITPLGTFGQLRIIRNPADNHATVDVVPSTGDTRDS